MVPDTVEGIDARQKRRRSPVLLVVVLLIHSMGLLLLCGINIILY